MSTRTRWIGSALACGVLLAGCSAPSSSTSSSSTSAPAGSSGAAPAASTSLVIGGGDIDHLDMAQFHSVSARLIMANVYSTAYQEDMKDAGDGAGWLQGTGTYVAGITEPLALSEDGLSGTLTVVDGASFAGGEPVTAEDVAWSLKRVFFGPGYTVNLGNYMGMGTDPDVAVTVKDDKTVLLTFERRSAMVEKILSFTQVGIIDSSVAAENGGEDGWASECLAQNPTSSGAYSIESWTRGQSMKLTRNDDTPYGKQAAMDEITLQVIPDQSQRLLALKGGQIDIAMELSPELIAEAEADPALAVHRLPSSAITFLAMNNESAPLDDPKVRQAISHAIPYDALLNSVMMGYGKPAGGPLPEPIEASVGTELAYQTDIEKAKALLAEAGATDLSLKLTVNAENSQHVQAATFIQDSLGKAGVTLEIESLPGADYTTKLNAKELQMSINSWYSYGEDPFYQLQFTLGTGAFTNYAQYSNAEVDALIDQGFRSVDPTERAEIARAAQEIVIDEAPWAFLYTADHIYVTSADITGITNTQDKVLRLQHVARR